MESPCGQIRFNWFCTVDVFPSRSPRTVRKRPQNRVASSLIPSGGHPGTTIKHSVVGKVQQSRADTKQNGRGNDIAYTQVHHVISGKCRVKVTSSRSPAPHGPLFGLTVSMRVHFHIHLLEVGCKPTPPLPATAIRVYRSAIGAVHCVVHDSSGLSGQVNGRPLIAARTRLLLARPRAHTGTARAGQVQSGPGG